MPEYHQIQTTVACEPSRFPEMAERFARVLREIGCSSPALDTWIAALHWEGAELAEGVARPWIGFELAGAGLTAAPCVISGGPDIYPRFSGTWVQFDLLFESASIEDNSRFPEVRFEPGLAPALWTAVSAFADGFPDHGVFLTNEWSDGRPWEGMVEGDAEKLWSFDLGLVPEAMAPLFAAVPETHWSRREDGRLAFADRRSWSAPPWMESVDDR